MGLKRLFVAGAVGLLFVVAMQVAVVPAATHAAAEMKSLLVREQNLDAQGNIKVHEQGTANVLVQNADADGRVMVVEQGTPTERGTPVVLRNEFNMPDGLTTQFSTKYKVPDGQNLVLKTVTAAVPFGARWSAYVVVPPVQVEPGTTPHFPIGPFYEGALEQTATAAIDITVPSGTSLSFKVSRSDSSGAASPIVNVSGYLIEAH